MVLLIGAALGAALLYRGYNPFFLWISCSGLWLTLAGSAWHAGSPRVSLPRTKALVFVGLFYCWLLLSIAWSPMPHGSWTTFWSLAFFPAGLLIYSAIHQNPTSWKALVVTLAVIGGALAHIALAQYLQNDIPRSTFANKNNHAAFLNLFLVSAAAYFAISHRKTILVALGYLLFVLSLSIFITGSRGAILGSAIGLLIVFTTTLFAGSGRRWILISGLIVAAAITSKYIGYHDLAPRVASLATVADFSAANHVDAGRYLIWQNTIELIRAQPWLGHGLGSFYLSYPTVRDPADTSGGYYAHNDYLQLWMEAGLPALLLVSAICISSLIYFFSALRRRAPGAERIEMAGFIGALAAVAAHTFFTFNFYIPAIAFVSGIFFGRSIYLAASLRPEGFHYLTLPPINTKSAPRSVFLLVTVAMAGYFASNVLSAYFVVQASKTATTGDWIATKDRLDLAQTLAPDDEVIMLARASLARDALINSLHEQSNQEGRLQVYDHADRLYREAASLNIYRSDIWSGLAILHWRLDRAPDFNAIDSWFIRALSLDPRDLPARMSYAAFLQEHKGYGAATRMLDDGLRHWHPHTPLLAKYLELFAEYLHMQGDHSRAEHIETRRNVVEADIRRGFQRILE